MAGEIAVLRRPSAAPTFEVEIGAMPWGEFPWDGLGSFDNLALRAVVRNYQPQDLVGAIKQGDMLAIVSDAELARSGWPGPPRNGDRLWRRGRNYTVMGCDTRLLRDRVAMHHLHLRG
jgi:hypothetical protein